MYISWGALKGSAPQVAPKTNCRRIYGSGIQTPVFEAKDQGQQSLAAAAFLLNWLKLLLYLHAFWLGESMVPRAFFSFPFLFSGCDVNSPRQPGTNGEGEEEARDGQTPLHLAASWGLEETVQCLLEFGTNVNAQVWQVSLFLGVRW